MRLKIGQQEWVVKRKLIPEQGITHHEERVIIIADRLDEHTYKEVLLHEVLHACWYFCGLDGEKKLDEEDIINRLSPVLFMVLVDNPNLLAYVNITRQDTGARVSDSRKPSSYIPCLRSDVHTIESCEMCTAYANKD